MSTPDFIPVGAAPGTGTPDFIPATQQSAEPDFIPASSSAAFSDQPKPEAHGFVGKTWDWLNSPLLDLHRQNAGPIESGVENFASGLTSPLSLGLAVGTLGSGLVEEGLVRAGLTAADAAGAVQKAKLVSDLGFLTKYGYDLGTNTFPQLEMNWGDYRAARTPADKKKALDTLEERGTEAVLGAITTGLATKGLAHDVQDIRETTPTGKAMLQNEYADAVYPRSAARRTAANDADQYEREINDLVPKPERQAAIIHNIEANGDPNVLEARAKQAEVADKPELAKEIRDGKDLNEDEQKARALAMRVMKQNGDDLRKTGRLPSDSDSATYLPHEYASEYVDPGTKQAVPHRLNNENFLERRVYPSIAAAELNGLDPIKNLAGLVADYHENAGYVLADDAYSEALLKGKTNDGKPLAVLARRYAPADEPLTPEQTKATVENAGGVYRGQANGVVEITLPSDLAKTLPNLNPKLAEFVSVSVPEKGLDDAAIRSAIVRKYGEMGGDPLLANEYISKIPAPEQASFVPSPLTVWRAGKQIPVAINSEVAPHALAMLEQPHPSRLARLALKISGGAKNSLLALSPFHWATVTNRMFELGKNPFSLPKIDWHNLSGDERDALNNGLMIGGRGLRRVSEGLVPSRDALINRIPLVGGVNRLIDDNLFGASGYISRLKFKAYADLRDAIRRSKPNLDPVEAGRVAASQINNKFGGLNYEVLGRKASTQQALRLMLLAPDFLESTGRSILDVAGQYGSPLVKRLVAFNVAHWLSARAMNYLISGDTHPELGFSVQSKDGKREYSLRTTLGDFLHFAENPRDFLANRVSPINVRIPAELYTGTNQYGEKMSPDQQVFEALRQITPIPIQGIYPSGTVSQPSALDKAMQSAGIRSVKKFTPAETLAHQLGSKHSDEGPLEGEQLETAQLRYRLEENLRTALNAHDNQARISAIRAIHEASQGENAEITPEQASKLIENANKYPLPLQSTVARLPLVDALEVWSKASQTEKRALRSVIQSKIEKWQSSSAKHTREQNDSMRQRIQAFRFSLAE